MSYCYECGEKISDDDLFCPFCGISITPIAPVESEGAEDISFDKTVAVSSAELEEMKQNARLVNTDSGSDIKIAPRFSQKEVPAAGEGTSPDSEVSLKKDSDTSIESPSIDDSLDSAVEKTDEKTDAGEHAVEIESKAEIADLPGVEMNLDDLPEDLPEEPTENASADKEIVNSQPESADSELVGNLGVIIPENTDVSDSEYFDEELPVGKKDADDGFSLISEILGESEDETLVKKVWQPDVVKNESEPAESGSKAEPEKSVGSEKFDEDKDISDKLSNLDAQTEISAPKIDPPVEPLVFDDEEVDNTPTHAYTPSDVKDIAENKIYSDENLKSILDNNSNAEASDIFDETKSETQQQETGQRKLDELSERINIPDIPLEETEDRDTQYDSVKIMEDKKPDVAEEIQNPAAVKGQESGSYTTPNFGSKNDTDGKKGLKLKPLEEGTVLNSRYEIIRKIGGGGMGAVYMATDRNLGETLRAVKEMVQSYIEESQQEKAIEDFRREATILSTLDHPAIPTIYDYFYDETEGRFYLVMKYISGGDLSMRLRSAPEGRIDEVSVAEWAIQIADVLHYLHNLQPPIVYRDLKPANVMLDSNTGRVMLIDFGIARSINKEEKGVTAVGTMGYAPPELFSGNVEARSDIYSLGSTVFHLLTGADPQSNPLLIFDFQKHPRPRHINPSLTDQMEKIIMRSVEYNAQNRFTSAAEMRDELIKHLKNLKAGSVSFGISSTPAAALKDQKVFCGFCGQQIIATDMFCAFCGSKQPLAQKGVHSSEYVSPLMTARLYVVGTNELETPAYALDKESNIVGRRDPITQIFPEVDLSKFDPQTKISRRHARIWREDSKFLLEDLGSSNGTMVIPVIGSTVRLKPHQPHNLVNGEKVKIGDTTLHFVVE